MKGSVGIEEHLIRKIICGTDPLNAMVFMLGKNNVVSIEYDDRYFHKTSQDRFHVYINKDSQLFLWKTISGMPTIIEYDCDF